MGDLAATPLPSFAEFHAPSTWRAIDFLSDLHLSESTPRTFEAFAAHLRGTAADAVFILGDLFEVWVGDDARHDGFAAVCAGVLREASSHRRIAFMAGNRDFLVGPDMLDQCGMVRLADPTVLVAFGRRVLLTHGDALCLSDRAYQTFRTQVRGTEWQRAFLAQPLAQRRSAAAAMRAESERRKAQQAPSEWFDVDPTETRRWMQQADTPWLVHGHTHAPARHAVAADLVRYVLSDWDFDPGASPARGDVLRLGPDGLHRMAPAEPPC